MMAGAGMELFAGSVLLVLRLVGAGWIWTPPSGESPGEQGGEAFLLRLGRAVAVGLLLNLLPALALASVRAWTPRGDWMLWLFIVVLGAIRSRLRGGAPGAFPVRFVAALALVGLLTGLPLLQPPRSEWLVGGWDPGLYQNNAVAISRDGDLRGRVVSVYSAMTVEERMLFSLPENHYREIFPAVPIRIEDGSLPLYFFHLTPMCGAWFLRMGGMGLLLRMPAILALWGLPPMLALCGLVGMGGWRKWVVLACWLCSPMWWYHQAIPTTEMLYLLLLLGGALLYVRAASRGVRVPWGALGALFAVTANHLNAAVLIGVLLAVAGWVEGVARTPGRMARIGLGFVAIALAIVWNLHFAGITVMRLEEKDQALRIILGVFSGSAVLALGLAGRPLPAAIRTWAVRAGSLAAAAAGLAMAVVALGVAIEPLRIVLLEAARFLPGVGPVLVFLIRIVPFQGPLAVAWAGVGLVWLFLLREDSLHPAKTLVFGLGAVCLLLFLQPGIAPLYPWALRRTVVFWVPLLAWAQAFVVVRAVETVRTRGGRWRWAALLLLVPALVESLFIAAQARRVGDYPGFGDLLASWERTIAPDDLVVADDPRWGTPLLLAGGREVINGRLLWQSHDPEFQRGFMEALRRMRAERGCRLLWLTSTDRGRDIYPVELGGDSAPLAEFPYAHHTVAHSRRASRFAVVPQDRRFRLYEWDGTYRLRGGRKTGPAEP